MGLGELVRLPQTDIAVLANNPTALARHVVDLERANRQLTWFVVGLAFIVWIMLQGRR